MQQATGHTAALPEAAVRKHTDSSAASKFQEQRVFLEKDTVVLPLKTQAAVWRAGCQRLSGALVVKKKVFVLAEQAEFQASAATSSNKKCPDAHEHHDYVR